jgi:hypothetical protein
MVSKSVRWPINFRYGMGKSSIGWECSIVNVKCQGIKRQTGTMDIGYFDYFGFFLISFSPVPSKIPEKTTIKAIQTLNISTSF